MAALASGIACALMLIVVPNISTRGEESFLVDLSDSDDPTAFSSRDYRDGNALPPGARASPKAVDKIYDDVTKKVASLEERVKKLKKHISGNEEVNIVLGSRGPPGCFPTRTDLTDLTTSP